MSEKLIRGLVHELEEKIPYSNAYNGFVIPGDGSLRILGYSITTNDFRKDRGIDFKLFGGKITEPTLLVNREGGLRFSPIYYPRVELYSFAGDAHNENELKICWDIDMVVRWAMEYLGPFKYQGQKFGTPVGESDGIPAYEESINRYYVYRSFLLSHVGP